LSDDVLSSSSGEDRAYVDGPYDFSSATSPMFKELAHSNREEEGLEEKSYASGR
jgi:hypothetical protein